MGLKLAGVMLILMLAMGGIGYWYFQDSQAKIATLHENNAKLDTAVKLQTATIEQQKKDIVIAHDLATETMNKFAASRAQVETLRGKFNKVSKLLGARDIGKLGQAKPKVIKRIINKGSRGVSRCFEILSGRELTKKEKDAEKKSQINTMCPDLANPKYVPNK
jgi:hypothetical protein